MSFPVRSHRMRKARAPPAWPFGRSESVFGFSEMADYCAGLWRLRHLNRTDGEVDSSNRPRRLEDCVDRRDVCEVDSIIDKLVEWQFHTECRRERRNVAPTLGPGRSGEQQDVEIQAFGQALEIDANESVGITAVRTEVRVHGRTGTVTHVNSSRDVEGGIVNEGRLVVPHVGAE